MARLFYSVPNVYSTVALFLSYKQRRVPPARGLSVLSDNRTEKSGRHAAKIVVVGCGANMDFRSHYTRQQNQMFSQKRNLVVKLLRSGSLLALTLEVHHIAKQTAPHNGTAQ